MKFGLIPGYYAAPVSTAEYTTGLARAAEEFGFESIWPVEHVVMPEEYESNYPYSPDGRMPIPDAAIPRPDHLEHLRGGADHESRARHRDGDPAPT